MKKEFPLSPNIIVKDDIRVKHRTLKPEELLPRLDAQQREHLETAREALEKLLVSDPRFIEAIKAHWKAQGLPLPRCAEESEHYYEILTRDSWPCSLLQIIRTYPVLEVPGWPGWQSIPADKEVDWHAIWNFATGGGHCCYLLTITFPVLEKVLRVRFDIPEHGAKIKTLQGKTDMLVVSDMNALRRGDLQTSRGVKINVPCEFLDSYDWL